MTFTGEDILKGDYWREVKAKHEFTKGGSDFCSQQFCFHDLLCIRKSCVYIQSMHLNN